MALMYLLASLSETTKKILVYLSAERITAFVFLSSTIRAKTVSLSGAICKKFLLHLSSEYGI